MKLNYEFSIQEVADKFVAVLKALQDGMDVPAIVSLLLSTYDVDPQEAEAEVNTFIDMLVSNALASK